MRNEQTSRNAEAQLSQETESIKSGMDEAHKEDGWNEEYFQDLLNAQDALGKIGYEIRNCQRVSKPEELIYELNCIIEQLEQTKYQLGEE